VLADYVDRQEVHFEEALQIARRIFFENSNKLYSLGIDYVELGSPTSLKGNVPVGNEVSYAGHDYETTPESTLSLQSKQLARIPPDLDLASSLSFIRSQGIRFIRLAWVDYVNLCRYRVIPIEHFTSTIGKSFIVDPEASSPQQVTESGISIVRVGLVLGVHDNMPPGLPMSGDFDLKPDFSSMWKAPFAPNHAYMMGKFFEKPYAGGGESKICPRTILYRVIQYAKTIT
jgi:glutamine synthetase